MSFSYNPGTPIFYVRSLIPDTNVSAQVFSDEELNGFLWLTSSQGLYASGQAAALASVQTVVPQVFSYRRAAAMAIDVIAADQGRLAIIQQILDVKIDGGKAQAALHEVAESLREQDDIGNFGIAEMVFDPFAARERAYAQLLRLGGGA